MTPIPRRLLALAILAALPAVAAAAEREVPLASLDLTHWSQDYKRPQVDKSIDGNPMRIGGKTFERGLGAHADARLHLAVNGATRFRASVGVDDEVGTRGFVRFLVVADGGRTLFDSGIMKGGDAAKAIDVPLAGVTTLLLITEATHPTINHCHANWAEARFDVEGEVPTGIALAAETAEILTPPAPKTPRINGPKIFGVRPGSPILYSIPATGDRPMKFEATNLPPGATFDSATGRLGGAVKAPGTYTITLRATNGLGSNDREFRLVVGDKLALTPPMGWNSWNCFAGAVDAEKVKSAADAMVSSGLVNHGWSYVNVDDYWQQKPEVMANDPTLGGPGRDAQGNIVPNPRFPDMKALGDYIHDRGLKFGIYSSPGPMTCGHCLGSFGYEEQDAAKYAEWGVDFLKYDWCGYRPAMEKDRERYKQPPTTYPTALKMAETSLEEHIFPYRKMGELLKKQPRDIVYSLCQYGRVNVWDWGRDVDGHLWRTTGDIVDSWTSMSKIGFSQLEKQGASGPGGWSDPDMLVVGRLGWGKLRPSRLTPSEQYTHITIWSILSAPLLIGCDMTQMDAFTLGLLTNDEVIAVNQDPLGKQPRRAWADGTGEVWAKELEDGSVAVALFNRGELATTVSAKWSDLGLTGPRRVRDLWRQRDLGDAVDGEFRSEVGRHGVRFVRIAAP